MGKQQRQQYVVYRCWSHTASRASRFYAVHPTDRGRVYKRAQNYHLAHMTPCLYANTSEYDRRYWKPVMQPDGTIIWVYIGKDAPWE